MRTLVHRALAFASFATAAALPAQVTVIDEGSFSVSKNGDRVGAEAFRILSSTASILASATVSYGTRRLLPELLADSAGRPVQYKLDVKLGGQMQEQLHGAIIRGRMSVRVSSPRGPSAKEYVVANGAVVLEDEVFHQYYFLASQKRRGSVPVVIPRRHVQILMRVSEAGTEQLTIGGHTIEAEHLTLTEPGGAVREVWTDAKGRVLKVTIPADGLTALRDDPPR